MEVEKCIVVEQVAGIDDSVVLEGSWIVDRKAVDVTCARIPFFVVVGVDGRDSSVDFGGEDFVVVACI